MVTEEDQLEQDLRALTPAPEMKAKELHEIKHDTLSSNDENNLHFDASPKKHVSEITKMHAYPKKTRKELDHAEIERMRIEEQNESAKISESDYVNDKDMNVLKQEAAVRAAKLKVE